MKLNLMTGGSGPTFVVLIGKPNLIFINHTHGHWGMLYPICGRKSGYARIHGMIVKAKNNPQIGGSLRIVLWSRISSLIQTSSQAPPGRSEVGSLDRSPSILEAKKASLSRISSSGVLYPLPNPGAKSDLSATVQAWQVHGHPNIIRNSNEGISSAELENHKPRMLTVAMACGWIKNRYIYRYINWYWYKTFLWEINIPKS